MSKIFPWDIAKKTVIASLPIKVFVANLRKDDDVEFEIDLDLGDKDHRMYLGKITAWAVSNNYSVETMNKNDAEGVV